MKTGARNDVCVGRAASPALGRGRASPGAGLRFPGRLGSRRRAAARGPRLSTIAGPGGLGRVGWGPRPAPVGLARGCARSRGCRADPDCHLMRNGETREPATATAMPHRSHSAANTAPTPSTLPNHLSTVRSAVNHYGSRVCEICSRPRRLATEIPYHTSALLE